MGPIEVRDSNIVTILHRSKVPVFLRPLSSSDGNEYRLVGDCYVHGIIRSKAASQLREKEEFELWTQIFNLKAMDVI